MHLRSDGLRVKGELGDAEEILAELAEGLQGEGPGIRIEAVYLPDQTVLVLAQHLVIFIANFYFSQNLPDQGPR